MSGPTVSEFMGYWEAEGQAYVRHGDYEWMASLVPGKRVLEIGCGPGFGTASLVARGLAVMVLDSLAPCLAATAARVGEGRVTLLEADVTALHDDARAGIEAFAPDAIVCWLMGAPADVTGASAGDGGKAVVAYRERAHRAVAELAASLPGVVALHFVDRTAIAWQAKDIGRDTLVSYHLSKTLQNLPLTAERRHALFRKLEQSNDGAPPRKTHPAMKGWVPTLASMLVERKN